MHIIPDDYCDNPRIVAACNSAVKEFAGCSGSEAANILRRKFAVDIVYGAFREPASPRGYSVAILKGLGLIKMMQRANCRRIFSVSYAPTLTCIEEAMAMCQVYGDDLLDRVPTKKRLGRKSGRAKA